METHNTFHSFTLFIAIAGVQEGRIEWRTQQLLGNTLTKLEFISGNYDGRYDIKNIDNKISAKLNLETLKFYMHHPMLYYPS